MLNPINYDKNIILRDKIHKSQKINGKLNRQS